MGSAQSQTSADAQVRSHQSPSFGEWQDIASAPRDGSPILIVGHGRVVKIGFYVAPDSRKPSWPTGADWFHCGYTMEGSVRGSTATHWMSLPTPPSLGDGSSRTATKANSGLNTINEVSQ